MKNLTVGNKVIGIITTVLQIISLVLITCICNGQKLTLEHLTIENQISYFSTFGKPVKQTEDVMGCVILKIDARDFPLWLHQSSLTKQQCQAILDLVCYPKQVQMQKKCLLIRSYPYQLIIRFSSSPYKMVWIALKQNWHTEFQLRNLPEENSILESNWKNLMDSILR